MNIFAGLRVGHPWRVQESRYLTWDEVNSVLYAEVVPSQFWYSVCFHLNTGKCSYVPLSSNSNACAGDIVDPAEIKVLILENDGDKIVRIEI